MLGGSPGGGPSLADGSSSKAQVRSEGDPDPLPDFLASRAGGNEPSFVGVSLRILRHARLAGGAELARLRHEVNDARYETHPGYDLAREAVNQAYRDRLPERHLLDLQTAESRRRFLREWGERDMRGAFVAAMRIPPPGHRAVFLNAALERGAKNDPDAAMELVRGIRDPDLRQSSAYHAVIAAVSKTPDAFAALAVEFPLQAPFMVPAAFQQMAREDPDKALAKLEEVLPAYRNQARSALLEGWAREDHAAAFQWAKDHGADVPSDLFYHWMESDPIPALESALGGDLAADDLVEDIASLIPSTKKNQRDEIAGWLGGLEDESLRARLSTGLFEGVGAPSSAVLDAARFAAGHPDSDLRNLNQLVIRIPDARERREWIRSLPTSVERQQMAWQAGRWLTENRTGFAEYVEDLPTTRAKRAFMKNAIAKDYENREALKAFAAGQGIPLNPGSE